MIDIDRIEKYILGGKWENQYPQVIEELLAEVKRLREESKKKGDVLTTLDEMIGNYTSHVEMMKALEQGLDLPETWKEMVE